VWVRGCSAPSTVPSRYDSTPSVVIRYAKQLYPVRCAHNLGCNKLHVCISLFQDLVDSTRHTPSPGPERRSPTRTGSCTRKSGSRKIPERTKTGAAPRSICPTKLPPPPADAAVCCLSFALPYVCCYCYSYFLYNYT
jgi:hypothetical protein